MDRIRETIIASVCLLSMIYLGIVFRALKEHKAKEVSLQIKIDSLKHEIFIYKLSHDESTRASR